MNCGLVARRAAGAVALLLSAGSGGAAALADSAGVEVRGDEPSYLDVGVGAFNAVFTHGHPATPEARIEFRYGDKLLFIGPAAGLLVNFKGGVYGYGGVYSDIALDRFILTPLAAIGGYSRGGSENLGGTFQFRLSLNAAYELDDKSRVGVQYAHTSNAGIHSLNPGENEVLLTYGLPLSNLLELTR